MDLSDANTEAGVVFVRFHEKLSHSTKMAAIGLCLVEDGLVRGTSRDEFMRTTYQTGALWGGMPDWSNPSALLAVARAELGEAGLVRAFSAFDLYITALDADLDRWRAFRGLAAPAPGADRSTEDENTADRALRFYTRRAWSTERIAFLLPVYRYYRLARDCSAHRAGLVSAALADASKRSAWSPSIEQWDERTDDWTTPPLVELEEGAELSLVHRDAILASSVLLRVARDMNAHAIAALGAPGLTYLAYCHTLVGYPPDVRVAGCRSPIAVIHDALHRRYGVKGLTEPDTIAILRSIDIWTSCRSEFARLQREGYFPP